MMFNLTPVFNSYCRRLKVCVTTGKLRKFFAQKVGEQCLKIDINQGERINEKTIKAR